MSQGNVPWAVRRMMIESFNPFSQNGTTEKALPVHAKCNELEWVCVLLLVVELYM